MVTKRTLMCCAASLGLLLSSAHAAAQAPGASACEAEIEKAEARIAAARKMKEYKTDKGRNALSSADRQVNQARNHAAKGESRSCASAARKGVAELSKR